MYPTGFRINLLIREELSDIVRPIFDSVRPNGHRDQSLPEVVFSNRRNRAYARVLDALFSRGVPTVPEDLRTRLESMIETWSTQAFDDAFQPIQDFEIQRARTGSGCGGTVGRSSTRTGCS
jgi:hypothetical protein